MHVNPQVIFKYHETETPVKMSPNATNPIIYLKLLGEYSASFQRDSPISTLPKLSTHSIKITI